MADGFLRLALGMIRDIKSTSFPPGFMKRSIAIGMGLAHMQEANMYTNVAQTRNPAGGAKQEMAKREVVRTVSGVEGFGGGSDKYLHLTGIIEVKTSW